MSQQPDDQPGDEKPTVKFKGPGQWRSQAAEAQDGLTTEQQAEIDAAVDEPGED